MFDVINITNGQLHAYNEDLIYKVGDELDYICEEGYEKTAKESLSCLTNGTWSTTANCKLG